MPTVALIAEGLTDQLVISRLIRAMYEPRDCDDLVQVNPLQPVRDTTDEHHAPHAGWEKVFEYCENYMQDALATNDFVVVHIDTDQGDHVNFGVALTDGGTDRSYLDLIEDTREVLTRKMGEVATNDALARIIFAIAVHSTESWLLLILYNEEKEKASFSRLTRLLDKRSGIKLKKEGRIYGDMMRSIKDRDIQPHAGRSHSLGILLTELRSRISLPSSPSPEGAAVSISADDLDEGASEE